MSPVCGIIFFMLFLKLEDVSSSQEPDDLPPESLKNSHSKTNKSGNFYIMFLIYSPTLKGYCSMLGIIIYLNTLKQHGEFIKWYIDKGL